MIFYEQPPVENDKYYEPIKDEEFEELLKKFDNPSNEIKKFTTELKKSLNNIYTGINKEYKFIKVDEEEFEAKLFNDDGTIRMESFIIKNGGPYRKDDEEFKNDKKKVGKLEKKWSDDNGIENFREEKEKNHGELWEKAITVIFNKILKTEFLVARASKYDDYMNGIDTVIINKETGHIVCALDEVSAKEESSVDKIKSEKIENKNKCGGAKIKYGVTFNKNGEIIKKSIDNIPIFYMRLSGEKLINLLKEMCYKPNNEKLLDIELETFKDLIISLEKQKEKELKNENISAELKEQLVEFSKSLEKMRNILEKNFKNQTAKIY